MHLYKRGSGSNQQPSLELSVLYLEYPVATKTASKYNGVELIEMTLKDQVNGHYIAMSGYDATTGGISYKFHDPIYGIINYFIVSIKENDPTCVTRNTDGTCALYLNIKQLPAGFKGTGTFLLAQA